MSTIMIILAAIASFVAAAAAKVAAEEFKAWQPRITARLVAMAVARMPIARRERMREEWASHLEEAPGDVSKVITALGFVIAAWRMDSELSFRLRSLMAPLGRDRLAVAIGVSAFVEHEVKQGSAKLRTAMTSDEIRAAAARQINLRRILLGRWLLLCDVIWPQTPPRFREHLLAAMREGYSALVDDSAAHSER